MWHPVKTLTLVGLVRVRESGSFPICLPLPRDYFNHLSLPVVNYLSLLVFNSPITNLHLTMSQGNILETVSTLCILGCGKPARSS